MICDTGPHYNFVFILYFKCEKFYLLFVGNGENLTNGKNSLIVGNGEKIKSMATSSSKFKLLNLHDILYVPNITKNLLSVSKLAANKNILVEFDKNYCFMKDESTRKAIL